MANKSEMFTGGFIFGICLCLGWALYYISSLDVGTSQDPRNLRHIDDSRGF